MATWSDQPLCTSVSAKPSDHTYVHRPVCRPTWLIVGVLVAVVWGSAHPGAQTSTIDRILAIVDGQIIMHSDVRAFIDLRLVEIPAGPRQEADVLTFLIERRVVLDQVDRFVVTAPDPEVVARRLDGIVGRLSGDTDLDRILARVGLTHDDLRQVVADEIRRDAYLADRFGLVEDRLQEAATADWISDLLRRALIRRVPGPDGLPGPPE